MLVVALSVNWVSFHQAVLKPVVSAPHAHQVRVQQIGVHFGIQMTPNVVLVQMARHILILMIRILAINAVSVLPQF